ncbi:hypothetical protein CMI37_19645 [Candidatus Pacearchaeota archaeon]|nr:hypothetical protein [Candidatus Pacearchaeota archaeon]
MAVRKKTEQGAEPLMAKHEAVANATRTRRNKAADIVRTDRFRNIENGMIPFKYTRGVANNSNIEVRDTIILCQKAYYNFSVFRNTIDLMTEFSISNLYYTGGSRKSREFFETLFRKINIDDLQSRFFREYYRSGNVFIYRFNAEMEKSDAFKINQTFGLSEANENIEIPSKYIILNPSDIQLQGSIAFSSGVYYKVITDYELQILRHPQTDEQKEVFESLPEETKKLIKDTKRTGMAAVTIPLNTDRLVAVFYKKQDYEPFSVPMGYPVLEDINWKQEMKQMDMAVARTTNQAILLITMGAKPEDGGVNQKNLMAMQKLFENESVGRVLISDYTTDAKFVIPDIGNILDPKKYDVVNQDIQMGLNNILLSDEKFANTSIKVQVFMERLKQGRRVFLENFLMPEIKRVSKEMGFKNYPDAHFEEVDLRDTSVYSRIYSRLIELGVLTAEEGMQAIESGRFPTPEESLESQKKFQEHKNEGLYEPLIGGAKMPQMSGRPPGAKKPKEEDKKTPVGTKAALNFSLSRIQEHLNLSDKLNLEVEASLRQIHKRKRLSKQQKEVAREITNIVIANEDPPNWLAKAGRYAAEPTDRNHERVKKVQDVAYEHQVDDFLAGILYASVHEGEK